MPLLGLVAVVPLTRWALDLVEWIRGAGAVGVVAYALAYVLATLFFLPGSVLTLGAGFAYGPVWGTLLASPVSVAAATLAFLLGRTVARAWIARRMSGHAGFSAIDAAIGEQGFKIVFLMRLSPLVPFNVLNYALGLTRVRLRDYVLASLLGMFPGTVLYVYLGSLVTSASQLLSGGRRAGGWTQALYWGGLAATLVATIVLTRLARTALARQLDRSSRRAAEKRP